MKYAVRDESGKFTRVTKIEPFVEIKHMTTIDNATQEPVTETLPVVNEEETVIRGKFQQMIDAVVGASKFANSLDEMKGRIDALQTALENAEQRVQDAIALRKDAMEDAQAARADAKMAREAYTVVDNHARELASELAETQIAVTDYKIKASAAEADASVAWDTVRNHKELLEAAREERDHFREAHGALEATWEATRHDYNLHVEELETTITNLRREADGLHHKINGLEDANKAASDRLSRLQGRLDSIRHAVVD